MRRGAGGRGGAEAGSESGAEVASAGGPGLRRQELSLDSLPHLRDHRLRGVVVLPGAFYVERALAMATAFGAAPRRLEEITFHRMLLLEEGRPQTAEAVLSPRGGGEFEFRLYSKPSGERETQAPRALHASMRLHTRNEGAESRPPAGTSLKEFLGTAAQELSGEDFYSGLNDAGNQYGLAFRLLERLWRSDGQALARLRIPAAPGPPQPDSYQQLAFVEAAAQTLLAAADREDGRAHLLTGLDRLHLYGPLQASRWALARLRPPAPAGGGLPVGDVLLLDESGQPTAELAGVRFTTLPAEGAPGPAAAPLKLRIAVAATFTADPLKDALAFWMREFGVAPEIVFAPYNQPFQQLLTPASLLSTNRGGLNVVLVRFEDWSRGGAGARPSAAERERLLAGHPRHALPNRVEVAHLNRYETEYLFEEIFNERTYLRHGVTLRDGDCVVDVGANIGLFSLFVQQHCPGARVYAFEPSPPAFKALKINAALYGPGVRAFNCGLSDRNGEAPFTFYPKSSVFSGFHADAEQDRDSLKAVVTNLLRKHGAAGATGQRDLADELTEGRMEGETFVCPLRTLSSVIAEQRLERIDLLKIDAEKSELDILRGVEEEDWGKIRQLVIEAHDHDGKVVEEISSLLKARGFGLVVEEQEMLGDSGLYNIYATRQAVAAPPEEPSPAGAPAELGRSVDDLVRALGAARGHSRTPHFVCVCPASPGALADARRRELFSSLERRLASGLSRLDTVHLITPAELLAAYPVADYYDARGEGLGRVPYTPRFFAALGTMIARKYHALQRGPYKVVALDCDQTLWKGLCGEDGPRGVELDAPRRRLQEFMAAQRDAGMLLCLCSKNNAEDVDAVFASHPEMPLRPEHFVSRRLNWKAKSENLKSLAQELGLGLESFILVDDSPVECAEVEANCPGVLALQLPARAEDIPDFLRHVWAFDRPEATEEDRQRTRLYRQHAERQELRRSALTFESFLAGLGLEIHISPAGPPHLARLAQLTQRTNQFNATAIRRSEAEIRELLDAGGMEGLVVEVSDRFGDYGLVGLIIFKAGREALDVDTFLLSCRALGRGVEHRMLARLGEAADAAGCTYVNVPYLSTGKNQPALDFLNEVWARLGTPPGGRAAAAPHPASREEAGGGFLFRFSAGPLSGLTFSPPAEPAAGTTQPAAEANLEPREGPAPAPPPSPAFLRRVATELRGVEQILTSIESQGRRRRPEAGEGPAPPNNEVERTIAQIWQEVLGLEEVGVQDNFFDLGGTSLQAVLVVSELEERLGVDLSSLSMFDRTTVRSLAGMLRAADEGEWGEEISARRGRGERRRAKSLARLRGAKKADRRRAPGGVFGHEE